MPINERSISLPEQWAKGAQTVIPAPPVPGISYRNTTVTPAQWARGQDYSRVADSAQWNQMFWTMSGLLQSAEQYGIMPYSPYTKYMASGLCIGFDGRMYQALQENGPGTPIGVQPVSNTTVWRDYAAYVYPGKAIGTGVVWWVRTDGNDDVAKSVVFADVNGSANLSSKAFKTISGAASYFASNYYLTKQGTITIQLGNPGTYAEPSWVNLPVVTSIALEPLPPVPIGLRARARATILGDRSSRTSYVWTVSSNPLVSVFAANIGNWSYEGMSIKTGGARTSYGIRFDGLGGRLWNTNVTSNAGFLVVGNTAFQIVGTCSITGNGGAATAFHGASSNCDILLGDSATSEVNTSITLDCPTAGSSSVSINTFARMYLYANGSLIGTVNGIRYSGFSLSIISTGGRLATIPGTAAGTLGNGSVAD